MCKGLSIDDDGVSRDTVFQEVRPGAGFETADFVEEKLGGATVVRLYRCNRKESMHGRETGEDGSQKGSYYRRYTTTAAVLWKDARS